MPLHGKIVVIKRSGEDGTEFPLTASCMFGRKAECDIRIRLPHVSKEHCRIDLNENKEIILTNLSSVYPTRINGEVLHQSEHLKHGDVITIVDRSFRFEYAPASTPRKKRTSSGATSEARKVLRHQQVADSGVADSAQKRISEVATDGANYDNIQRSLEKTLEMESQEDGNNSPFSDLYQMIKKSLDVKTPRKSSASVLQTPSSKFCTPRPSLDVKRGEEDVILTPEKEEEEDKLPADPKGKGSKTPESVKKSRKSFPAEGSGPTVDEAGSSGAPLQRRASLPLQKFPATEVIEQVAAPTCQSPVRRRSKQATPGKSAVSTPQVEQAGISPKVESSPERSSQNSGSAEKVKVSQKRKNQELGTNVSIQATKRKRVSFGGQLSPELFDKRLPPDSPLRKGAAPRRSLSLYKPKLSLLRRASVIGLLKEQRTPPKKLLKTTSPKTSVGKASPKSRSPSPAKKSPLSKSTSPKATSPKAATPAQKSPKSRSTSPKAATPAQKSPKSRSTSPKVATPAQKSPKSRSTSPKAATPAQKSPPKSRSTSPKAATPAQKSPKSRSTSPKVATPAQKSPKSRSTSPKAATPAQKSPKSRSTSPKAATPAQKSPPKSRSTSPKAATPAQKSPKSRSTSPKAATPAQKSPKSRSTSPKAATPAQKSPKSRSTSPKAATPAQKSPKSRACSPRALASLTPAKTPLNPGNQTPFAQGRFSVSRIRTPSPTAEVVQQLPSLTVTPKIPLRRKSMKSTSRRTPSVAKSAVKVLQRRSGISRASMKVPSSWANIVKFGQTKTSVVAPAEKKTIQKAQKKGVSKPQTPARKLKGHTSTGHADSPATIVVGRAHKRTVTHPTGAAPKVIINAALFKKDMKMDEDLTGLSEMFKTPINERRRKSVVSERSAKKTPAGVLGASMVEPSVLKTPEEPDEMIVSPLSVASTVKSRRYNSEAVQRLLGEEVCSESEQLGTDPKASSVQTPKQKPEAPVCLTGVKRIMKTPRQKAEPLEDIRGNLLVTPRQKAQPHDGLTGLKRIFKTPKVKGEPVEDLRGKLLKTPKARKSADVSLDGVKELFGTPVLQSQMLGVTAAEKTIQKNAAVEEKVGVKRLQGAARQKATPVKDNFGIKRLMKSPRLRNPPVEDFEGLKELMEEPLTYLTEPQTAESPDATESHPQSDADQPQPEPSQDPILSAPARGRRGKKPEATAPPAGRRATRERNAQATESRDAVAAVEESLPQPSKVPLKPRRGRNGKIQNEAAEPEQAAAAEEKVSPEPAMDASPAADVENKAKESPAPVLKAKRGRKPKQPVDPIPPQQDLPTEADGSVQPQALAGESADSAGSVEDVAQVPETVKLPDKDGEMSVSQKKSARGKRAKSLESEAAEDTQEVQKSSDEPVLAPVRGRRGKKTEAPAVKHTTRTRNAKAHSAADQPAMEAPAIAEVSSEAVTVQTAERFSEEAKDAVPSAQEVTTKPLRGRRAKAAPMEAEKTEADADAGTVGKPRRGRKNQSDVKKPAELAEDTSLSVETECPSQPPVRAKRGRNAPQREEQQINTKMTSQETSDCQEPPKKSRRTRQPEQDLVKPIDAVHSAETVPEKEQLPVAEPEGEPSAAAAKPRRGGRKAKPDALTENPAKSTDLHVDATEKPKRSRRGEQIAQEAIPAEDPKQEEMPVPSPQIIKPSRARAVRSEASQAAPAKRGRRGAAPPEVPPEEPASQAESAPEPAAPTKRGKRAAAKPKAEEEAVETSGEADSSQDSKTNKKSVRFRLAKEASETPKATPVKATRGRRSRTTEQTDAGSNDGTKEAKSSEEKNLSDVEEQPAKRGRRGAKVAEVSAEDTATKARPKTRRGATAKK
ncbi:proliferation marker protein Ki-67 isoform X3 [Fundulus heteroclitus]|uniref:proliferation marker protein Ki-67 isoform X3 n=1 Tax=Fundulus heteroclitus TaxID=8078 RepID=UPI00165C2807|nr:proliferation marker protein Ki-67 isoform X3 [Fundulus heteroclitus]